MNIPPFSLSLRYRCFHFMISMMVILIFERGCDRASSRHFTARYLAVDAIFSPSRFSLRLQSPLLRAEASRQPRPLADGFIAIVSPSLDAEASPQVLHQKKMFQTVFFFFIFLDKRRLQRDSQPFSHADAARCRVNIVWQTFSGRRAMLVTITAEGHYQPLH
jgi:hypothetical protein